MSRENKIYKLLIINPGSTSTKIAVYHNKNAIYDNTLRHEVKDIDEFSGILAQKDMRKQIIMNMLDKLGIDIYSFDAIVGRGGIVKPIPSGTYLVNEEMITDLRKRAASLHASALGGILAFDIAREANLNAYIVDPIVVDEMEPIAKLSGVPKIQRKSRFHALNQKAVAKEYAKDTNTEYKDLRLIVAHMGGGITIGAHKYGRVIDVNDGLAGEGPFSPERSGTVPMDELIKLCFSGKYTEQELLKKITKQSGMTGYIGTNDMQQCLKMIKNGDEYAHLVMDAMAYQISKEIGAMAAALEFRVDGIILTGGLAYSSRFTDLLKTRVSQVAPIAIYPGEKEMQALALGALRVLTGSEAAKIYNRHIITTKELNHI